ncbi:MAG: hypothetical protein Q8O57_13105, partial [Kiritimatiellota bacterium]|nr:hypothetical protein [Kiritimatiellota bacterium]
MTTEAMSQSQAERIYKDFGKFLVERQPVIHDASLLPHTKVKIMVAMKICEQYMCDIANLYVKSGKDIALKEIVKHLDALRICRGGLCDYSDIDAEDRNAATH